MNNIIEYTPSGLERKELAIKRFADSLDEYFGRKKLPGESKIEVTAADVERATSLMRLSFIDENKLKVFRYTMLTVFYVMFGLNIISIGYLVQSVTSRNTTSIFAASGMVIASFGGTIGILVIIRSIINTYGARNRIDMITERLNSVGHGPSSRDASLEALSSDLYFDSEAYQAKLREIIREELARHND